MPNQPLVLSLVLSSLVLIAATPSLQAQPPLSILDHNGTPISHLTDGDSIKLKYKATTPAEQPTLISFRVDPDSMPVGECTMAKGSDTCQTESLASLGWYWDKNHQLHRARILSAGSTANAELAFTEVQVAPRPVVMVHGFGSDASAWSTYLGDNGYLAALGVRGYAVGDGQVRGQLDLGSLGNPTGPTGTIRSNAETLRDYIAAVKQQTGAQMIDLIAHSMGSLVSRYYVDRVMPARDVAQLIMLGPPNEGTACANLPAALGYYLPAVLEIRPSYVRGVFNQQITHRHGVPFTVIAGTPIADPVKSPCTEVPTDLAIAFASATSIRTVVEQSDTWHSDLNVSPRVFAELVKPLLQKTVGEFAAEPDPAPSVRAEDELQFTRVFTGHVDAGTSATHTIQLDSVAVASFALFDPTRSLTVTVRGATGNTIQLDPMRNGLTVVKDPATLVYLGYGFNNPRPGPWQVTLLTTDATPRGGADYAITAQLRGGVTLHAQASTLLTKSSEPVQLAAQMDLAGQSIPIRDAQARIRNPAGEINMVMLKDAGAAWRADWTPGAPGLYSVDLLVHASAPDGSPIERSAFFSVEAQPPQEQFQSIQLMLYAALGLGVVLIARWWISRRRRAPTPIRR